MVSDVTQFIVALSSATGQSVAVIAEALGDLPGGILALTQVVIANPTLLPRAISTLIFGGVATLEEALAPIIGVLATLPPPLGVNPMTGDLGLIVGASLALGNVLNALLGHLPPPLIMASGSTLANAQVQLFNPPGLDVPADLQGAVTTLASALGMAPATAEALVRTALRNPAALPAALGAVGSGALGTFQVALAPVILDLVYGLPAPLGSSVAFPGRPDGVVATGATALGTAINGVREVLDPGSTTTPFVKVSSPSAGEVPENLGVTGLEGQDQAGDPGATPKKPRRPLVNLNVHKVNPLDRGSATDQGREDADTVGTDTGTNVKHYPTDRPGDGKIGVRDLVKRLTGGEAQDDDDGGSEAPRDRTGIAG